jgi:hypothetical protein
MTYRGPSEDTKAIAAVASQIGSTLLPDNGQWTNRFQVKSLSSSSLYTIAQRRSDHTWGCSCPGWRNHRRCKHLTDVLQRLAAVAISATASAFDQATLKMLASARTAYLDLSPAKEITIPTAKGRVLELD